MNEIKTPENSPDHHTVGHYFRAYDVYTDATHVFFCDSYDPRLGYWMTRADCPEEHKKDEAGIWRRNVSTRAVGYGRAFHPCPKP